MPGAWTPEQRNSVVKLMSADNMFKVEGQSLHIANGEDFFTTDEGQPNYTAAVEKVGRDLGLQFSKKGVATVDAQTTPVSSKSSEVDQSRLKTDSHYRNAYVDLRSTGIGRGGPINNKIVEAHMAKIKR
jgi:hypothetical protein